MFRYLIIFFILNFNNPVLSSTKNEIISNLKKINILSFNFIQTIGYKKENGENLSNNNDKDELYESALNIIRSEGKASTSFLQRKLQIGYNRAARIIDMMEDNGIVSKANHVGKRDVL